MYPVLRSSTHTPRLHCHEQLWRVRLVPPISLECLGSLGNLFPNGFLRKPTDCTVEILIGHGVCRSHHCLVTELPK